MAVLLRSRNNIVFNKRDRKEVFITTRYVLIRPVAADRLIRVFQASCGERMTRSLFTSDKEEINYN